MSMFNLEDDISIVKSVGTKIKEIFNDNKIYKIKDLLFRFPKNYKIDENNCFIDSNYILLSGVISSQLSLRKLKKSTNNISFILKKDTGEFKIYGKGMSYLIYDYFKGDYIEILTNYNKNIDMYSIEKIIKQDDNASISCDYKINKIDNLFISKLINNILENIKLNDFINSDLLIKYDLPSLNEYIRRIHFPKSKDDILKVIKRRNYEIYLKYFLYLENINSFLLSFEKASKYFSLELFDELKKVSKCNISLSLNNIITNLILSLSNDDYIRRIITLENDNDKNILCSVFSYLYVLNNYQILIICKSNYEARIKYNKISKILMNYKLNICLLDEIYPSKNINELYRKIDLGYIDIVITSESFDYNDLNMPKLNLIIYETEDIFNFKKEFDLLEKYHIIDMIYLTNNIVPTLIENLYNPYKITYEIIKCKDLFKNTIFTNNLDKTFSLNLNEQIVIISNNKYYERIKDITRYTNLLKLNYNDSYYNKQQIINDFINKKIQCLFADFNIFEHFKIKNITKFLFYTEESLNFAYIYNLFNYFKKNSSKAKSYFIGPLNYINKIKDLLKYKYLNNIIDEDFLSDNISKYLFNLLNPNSILSKEEDLKLFEHASVDSKLFK